MTGQEVDGKELGAVRPSVDGHRISARHTICGSAARPALFESLSREAVASAATATRLTRNEDIARREEMSGKLIESPVSGQTKDKSTWQFEEGQWRKTHR
jgi:hypothetical protein